MNEITHKLVTAGWATSIVGNEPSGCCCAASQLSDRSTAASTGAHSCGESTLAGDSSARDVALLERPSAGSDGSVISWARPTSVGRHTNATPITRLIRAHLFMVVASLNRPTLQLTCASMLPLKNWQELVRRA